MRHPGIVISALLVGTCLGGHVAAQERPANAAPVTTTDLESAFAQPPVSAHPRVWWHWMNGNISKDGIKKDLEWMNRIGIAGVQAFDANISTPQIVDKRIVYMTPEWKDAFRFAAQTTDRLGMELAIASSPGWSESGGPWVTPADGMKKLVWSETTATGGKRFVGKLATPPSVTGAFQSYAKAAGVAEMMGGGAKGSQPTFYGDVAVLAYPIASSKPLAVPSKTLSTKGEPADVSVLSDDMPKTGLRLALGANGEPATLTYAFDAPQTVRSARIFAPDEKSPIGGGNTVDPTLEASDDGTSWRTVAPMPLDAVPSTIGFAPVTARFFRLALTPAKPVPFAMGEAIPGAIAPNFAAAAATKKSFKIAEFGLIGEPKVNRFETKAGFSVVPDYYALTAQADPSEQGAPFGKIVDLTTRMKPDGSLDWTPPKGEWRIVRLGYSLTGITNHPAVPEATGLEVDKFDGQAVRRYLDTYIGMYRDTVGADLIGRKGVTALLNDSTEAGFANWTPSMITKFKALRGYDPTPWLPTLTGVLIGTRAQSDGFLYDYRRTLADLVASEHYGTIADVAHANNLIVYGEALEDNRPSIGDDMAMRSHADIPMAAMWTYPREKGPRPTYLADDKGAASVAHLYGRPYVAAESLTSIFSPWAYGPADLRRVIDLEFALGINRPIIHTSAHQPVDDKVPGLSLFSAGQFFTRHESWAELAKPWIDYISRNSFMLQQGRNVADVLYFYGEEGPITGLFGDTYAKDAPTRYGYDFANADVLADLMSVDQGELVAKSGARYRLLYLGGSSARMTLATLRRIARFVDDGAAVAGIAPTGSPRLGEDTPEYWALVARLWPTNGAKSGKRVIATQDVEAALVGAGVRPDFAYAKPRQDSQLLFTHRALSDGDAYFVVNRANRPEHVDARFRVAGKAPQLCRADTGRCAAVSYRIEGAETVVPLDFAAEDSFFVVFRQPAKATGAVVAVPRHAQLAMVAGSWKVAFQKDRGAPAMATLPKLGSLSEQADPGIKYFSGIATYTNRFTLPRGVRAGAPLMLDLGSVGTVAEVRVNGVVVGSAWHAPYRLDIGAATKAGQNTLEVRVANLWVNRLIGDAQPNAKKVTYTTIATYRPDAPLRPSGLIGPVTLQTAD